MELYITLDDGVTHNYVYDAENRYVKLGTTLVNTYDGGGLRVEKVTGGSTNVYVFSGGKVIAEYTPAAQTTAPTKEYVYLGRQLLATLDASGNPTYRHPDHLSARVFTNNSGTSIGTYGHLPFGETWYSTGTVDKWKFTSYERDTDTSLDYAMMRFDSARLARFGTPDPYAGSMDAGNPQSWNRYAYVTGDPVDFVDPLGLEKPRCTKGVPYYENDCQPPPSDPLSGFCAIAGGLGALFFGCDTTYMQDFITIKEVDDTHPRLKRKPAGKSDQPLVNTQSLGQCISSQFTVMLIFFSPTIGVGGGQTGNINGSATIFFGWDFNPMVGTITNDINTKGPGQMPRTSPLYTNQGSGNVVGYTDATNPWTNYTANGRVDQSATNTQIWELGNSLSVIVGTLPAHMGSPSQDPGGTLFGCYANATGIPVEP